MCLFVIKAHRTPVPYKEASKHVEITKSGRNGSLCIRTPYRQSILAFGDGYFFARDNIAKKRLSKNDFVYGGYLHSFEYSRYQPLKTRMFPINDAYFVQLYAIAIDVCADGTQNEMVSKQLYIPSMDLRNYTAEQIKKLENNYPSSFTAHTYEVLKLMETRHYG